MISYILIFFHRKSCFYWRRRQPFKNVTMVEQELHVLEILEDLPTIIFITLWLFLMFLSIFLSPQVKRYAIITYKHGIYKFPSVQSSCQNQHFVNTSNKLLKNRNHTFPVVWYFAWKLELLSNILWMILDYFHW